MKKKESKWKKKRNRLQKKGKPRSLVLASILSIVGIFSFTVYYNFVSKKELPTSAFRYTINKENTIQTKKELFHLVKYVPVPPMDFNELEQ